MSLLIPSDGQVSQVLEITECGDPELARSALQAKECDPQAAIAEFFDLGLEQFRRKYGWDEAAFAEGRDGQDRNTFASQESAPGFVIHPSDTDNPIYGIKPDNENFYNTAGTPRPPDARPPSRASTTTPPYHMLPAPEIAGFNSEAPSNHQEEDEQMQRALALSLESSGIIALPDMAPQESGVVEEGSSLPFFGPATRSEYKESEWAMTVVKPKADDPPAPSRAAEDGARFLRCRAENDYTPQHLLGPLLMILHAIPSARNALLQCSPPQADNTGNMPEWWKGIIPQQEQEGVSEPDVCGNPPPPTDELRRLVAFLDMSARSYAAVDSLVRAVRDEEGYGDVEAAFLNKLRQLILANHPDSFGVLFTKFVESADATEVDDWRWDTGLLSHDDSNTPVEGDRLYGLLDDMFLRSRVDDQGRVLPRWILAKPADVLIIRIEYPSKTYDIPATLYMDRFVGGQVQDDLAKVEAAILDMERSRDEALRWSPEDGTGSTGSDRRNLAQASIKWLQNKIARIEAMARWREHNEARAAGQEVFYLRDPKPDSPPKLTDDEQETVTLLKAKIVKVEQKAKKLNDDLEDFLQALEKLKALRAFLKTFWTKASQNEGEKPTCLYSLRGWSSSPTSCCLQRREKADNGQPTDKWYDMWIDTEEQYRVKHRELPISGEETAQEAINRKLKAEFDVPSRPTSLLLVYASEAAMIAEPEPLPQSLDGFIARDNETFASECTAHETEQPPADSQMESEMRGRNRDLMSGGLGPMGGRQFDLDARRARGGSPDSMATNKASLGSGASGDDRLADVFDDDNGGGAVKETAPSHWESQNELGLDTWQTPPIASTTTFPAGRMNMDDEFDETSSATLSSATLVGAEHVEHSSPPSVPPEAPPPPPPPRQPDDVGMVADQPDDDTEVMSGAADDGTSTIHKQVGFVAQLPFRGKPSDAQPRSDGAGNADNAGSDSSRRHDGNDDSPGMP